MVNFPSPFLLLLQQKLNQLLLLLLLPLHYPLTGQHLIQDVASTINITFLVVIVSAQDDLRSCVLLSTHHFCFECVGRYLPGYAQICYFEGFAVLGYEQIFRFEVPVEDA